MIIESTRDLTVGQVIEVYYGNQGGPSAQAKVLRRATFAEYIDSIMREDPEELRKYGHLYTQDWGTNHYEVSAD